ncbi:MAG: hypothetical protein ABIK20_05720 [Candidatus Omnitrophota bacterium]
MEKPITTPVLFLIFNSPDTTQRVFEEIRRARPLKLFVAADGPREGKNGESERCRQAREIIKKVDWECSVRTLFRAKNLGCKIACSNAVNWFFENEEEGIILEDDTLPDRSFFWFCQELLAKYRNDTRIMHIGGVNFQSGHVRGDGNYYFSVYNHLWGWASWRRAWMYYDVAMKTWPKFLEQNQLANIFEDERMQEYWIKQIQATHEGKIDTWCYQWLYAMWSQNGLTILPNVNLISNIGFGEGATHTTSKNDKFANMKTGNVSEIIHPSFVITNKAADIFTFKTHFQSTFSARVRGKIKNIFRKIVKNTVKKLSYRR